MIAESRTHSDKLMLKFHPPGYEYPLELPVILRGSRRNSGAWTWNGDHKNPTLRPSIRTRWGTDKTLHFWLNDGKCKFLNDSSEFAGLTLPLLELNQ